MGWQSACAHVCVCVFTRVCVCSHTCAHVWLCVPARPQAAGRGRSSIPLPWLPKRLPRQRDGRGDSQEGQQRPPLGHLPPPHPGTGCQNPPPVPSCHLTAPPPSRRDLAPRDPSGTSDPFARVSCCGHTQETAVSLGGDTGGDVPKGWGVPWGPRPLLPPALSPQVIKKTRFPRWDEVLEFELAEGELGDAVLSVEVWDWDMVGKNDFLGRVRASGGAGGTGATVCAPPPLWLSFPPKNPGRAPRGHPGCHQGLVPAPALRQQRRGAGVSTRGMRVPGGAGGACQDPSQPLPSWCRCRGRLGSLRLAVRLVEEQVLPPHCYQPFIQLLAEPIRCPGQVGATLVPPPSFVAAPCPPCPPRSPQPAQPWPSWRR